MRISKLLMSFLLVFACSQNVKAGEKDLLVFAAASMQEVMISIGKKYESQCDCRIRFSFASSSILARQIAAGAPADVFISANREWVDWLNARAALAGDAKTIARNRLVIATSSLTKDSFNILARGRFSMGNPTGVPAGIYAKQALESMGLWLKVKPNAVFAENVRVALSMVARSDLQAGIVYASDLKAVPALHTQFVFPQNTHAPIVYVAASVKGKGGRTSGFLSFLVSQEAQEIFFNAGFSRAAHG